MFRRLRLRTAIYELAAVAVVLAAVVASGCAFLRLRLDKAVEENLSLLANKGAPDPAGDARNMLVIEFPADDSPPEPSYDGFYDDVTLRGVEELCESAKAGKARMRIGKTTRIACEIVRSDGKSVAYIYDYSAKYSEYRAGAVTLGVAWAMALVAMAAIIFYFAKRAVAPIERAFEKQRELIANASHELKTPITIIAADLFILQSSDGLSEEQAKWLDGIGAQARRMGDLVNEMLELAKADSKKDKVMTKIDLSEILKSVASESEALAFEKKITLNASIPPGVRVIADRDDIVKLIYILFENALKYTDPGGVIDIALRRERRAAVLTVRNTGAGISREALPKLFDRFYRCDESHSEGGNFGLGLAIAKAIADSNGIVIGADSKEGEHTRFILEFKEAQ